MSKSPSRNEISANRCHHERARYGVYRCPNPATPNWRTSKMHQTMYRPVRSNYIGVRFLNGARRLMLHLMLSSLSMLGLLQEQ